MDLCDEADTANDGKISIEEYLTITKNYGIKVEPQKTNPLFKFQMAQLSNDDIGHVEELANSNRELSKNDFIFHIKVLPYPLIFRHILNLDGLASKCFNKFFFRIPTCLSSLIVLIQSVTTIGMRRFFLHISFIVIKT